MYFILKNASFPTTIGTITVQEGQVGGGGGSSTPTNVTFTINPTPSNATVVLTASGYTQSGNSITVLSGTKVSYTVSASGYVSKSGSKTVSYTQSLGVTLSAEGSTPVNPPSEPSVPDTLTLLAQNTTSVGSSPKRLAANAYVANMKQKFTAGSTIGYIEIPVVKGGSIVTSSTTIPVLNVWVFNANTNAPVTKVIDGQSYTTQTSTAFAGCQAIKVEINRSFDYPFYFGYDNQPSSKGEGVAYFSENGNYLSGTSFAIGTSIEASSNSVAICAAVYGEGSQAKDPDAVDNLTQIAFYNGTAASPMAANCYVANPTQIVPANTKISVLDVMVKGTSIEGVNIYVVNGETNTIVEMLADEQKMTPITSSRIEKDVIRLNVNKTYAYPVYFMFNAERTGSSANAMLMVSNATGSILLTDDEKKPAVGDVLSNFTKAYNVGHAIYS